MKTITALMWREWRIMFRSYLLYVVIYYLVINGIIGYSMWTLVSLGVKPSHLGTVLINNTTWFTVYAGGGFILLSMLSSVIVKEKFSGQVHNLLAYGIPFSILVLEKAIFVTLLSLAEIPLLVVMSLMLRFMGDTGYMLAFPGLLPATVLLYPVLMLLMSFLITLVNYIRPHLAQATAIFAFACGFAVLSYLRNFVHLLLGVPNVVIFILPAILLCLLFFALLKVVDRLPKSVILNA